MINYYRRSAKLKLKSSEDFKPGSWVYVESPTHAELKELAKTLDLNEGHVSDVLDPDEMPRIEREGKQLYLFTRFPFANDELHLETTPLLMIFDKDFLVTVASKPLPRFSQFTEGKVDFDTTKPDQLMLIILDQIVQQYDTFIAQTGKQIKAARQRLRVEQVRNKDFIDFVLIEEELDEFLAAMEPMNSMLRRLLINKHLDLSAKDRELIEDLQLANEQSIGAARSNIKSVNSIRDGYSTIMSNNLNRIISILTVLTAVLAVPTLIASVYGMNVVLPFQDDFHAFAFVIGFSAAVSLGLLWYFRHKDWL